MALLIATATIACSSEGPKSAGAPAPPVGVATATSDAAAPSAASDAAAPTAASDAATAATVDVPPIKLAVVGNDDEGIEVFALEAGALRKVSTTRTEDVLHLAWPDASAPLVVVHGRAQVGAVRGGKLQPITGRGRGDILRLIVADDGKVWMDRCLAWGEDNPEEEGCLRHRYWQLPPGSAEAGRPPRRSIVPGAAPPPTPTLSTSVGPDGRHLVACQDAAGSHVVIGADQQIVEPPTWRWLSTEPPIALVSAQPAGSGEGAPDPAAEPEAAYLVRGCTVDGDDWAAAGSIAIGPDRFWAMLAIGADDETTWELFFGATAIGQVSGRALVFAGGAAHSSFIGPS